MRIILAVIFVLLFHQPAMAEPEVQNSSTDGIRLFLAGDTIMTQPWSHLKEPRFLRLVDEIRKADVAIVNLETPIHEHKGYGQANSGGAHLGASPKIAFELAWAGIDMVSHANNHTFDYGSIGVLETLDNTAKAGLVLAGAGKDLQDARAPRYFKHPNGIVGLVSASASFHSYNVASLSRPDMRGRPGLNPLRKRGLSGLNPYRNKGDLFSFSLTITPGTASFLEKLSKTVGFSGKRFMQKHFNLLGMDCTVGEKHEIHLYWGGKFDDQELAANLAAIQEARDNADVVIFSIHAHEHAQGRALTRMAHQFIDAGTDIFVAHGPHQILGIEIYKGKPIFYGMGDFVFQIDQVERFPSEMYDELGLGEDATLEEMKKALKKSNQLGNLTKREIWESFAAVLNFQKGKVTDFRLIPQDLGFGHPSPVLGRPNYADNKSGKYIVDYTIKESAKYGTQIEYLESQNIGKVKIPD